MKLIDANLLLYAYNPSLDQHRAARLWLEETFSSPEPVALPWAVLLAFVRIGTNPRAFETPLATAEAAEIVTAWLALSMVSVVHPGPRHWLILRKLLEEAQVRGPLVSDAHLAALAIERGATLYTTDRDFARFPALRCVNPLAAPRSA